MSFNRIPTYDDYDTQSLARYDSQASINSISSRISVKSAFTKSPTKLFQKVSSKSKSPMSMIYEFYQVIKMS